MWGHRASDIHSSFVLGLITCKKAMVIMTIRKPCRGQFCPWPAKAEVEEG